MGPRSLWISGLALGIGFASAFIALALLKLIGLFTNLFFFGRWGTALVSPAGNRLGVLEVLIPVAGALIVGLMARYGSERIRGHGIPEAIESILISGSRVEPKVALLKPLSSAISIGSGGPFGAEGPIIMTGAAFGSMIAQCFHLSSSERKTLLVAGAAAGMSATFASPVAAVLLAVELLLFEWKPRSVIPVALASVIAGSDSPVPDGSRTTLPGAAAPGLPGADGVAWMRSCRPAGGGAIRGCFARRLRRRGCLRTPPHPLDVVAGDRRPGNRPGGSDIPASPGGGLRHDRRTLTGGRSAKADPGHPFGEIGDLGGFVGLRDLGRRSCAAAHDGRSAGRAPGDVFAGRRRRLLAPGNAWAPCWEERCALR